MTIPEALDLFNYDRWATEKQFKVIAALREDQYLKPLGSSFDSLKDTLVHIYGAQLLWFTRWTGESPTSLITSAEFPALELLRERWTILRDDIDRFLGNLSETQLNQRLSYRDMKGNPYSQPLCDLIRHVINHSTYHRGQIVTMLRQMGEAAVSTDLIFYYRERDASLL